MEEPISDGKIADMLFNARTSLDENRFNHIKPVTLPARWVASVLEELQRLRKAAPAQPQPSPRALDRLVQLPGFSGPVYVDPDDVTGVETVEGIASAGGANVFRRDKHPARVNMAAEQVIAALRGE